MDSARASVIVNRTFQFLLPLFSIGFILSAAYLSYLYNYLLFHTLAELFSIIIAYGIFMFAWNSRQFVDNHYLLFLGIAYFFIAALDILHTLAYPGMNIFFDYNHDLSIQIWLVSRMIESFSLVIASLFFTRKLRILLTFLIYTLISIIALLVIFGQYFPECYVEPNGLTPFKINTEYFICSILVLSLFLLKNAQLEKHILTIIFIAITLTIFSELAFTFYISAYGFSNFVGHIFKILSFYLIYQAIIKTGLTKPYRLLFKHLKEKEYTLKEAKKKSDSANQAKSIFLSKMTHELRTPLHGILGYTQILQEDCTPQQKHGLHIIQESGNHLLSLINDILDMAKVETGKIELYKTNFNLQSLLIEVSELTTIKIKNKNINFSLEIAHNIPQGLYADKRRIRQILLNLLSNAMKFTQDGTITLKVSFNLDKYQFKIKDTGIGISPEDLKIIFKPFEQVGDKQAQIKGTGLGLGISKNLVELMGGQLCVNSQINLGTEFYFELTLPTSVYNIASTPKMLERKISVTALKMVFPSLETLEHFYDLSLKGDLKLLKQQVVLLRGKEMKPFVTKINYFITHYKINELLIWFEGVLQHDK
ncbi:MAG: hypothetical protein KAH77_05910 [Thiomargarita sp.]|nr:hypothetical protein [Thiomargarita sp.]